MCCWILEVCPVPRAIVRLPGTGVGCTLLKQMRSGQRHSGSTMPYTTLSPCPIAALPSTVLTEGQGWFQNTVSPSSSWGSSQCQTPRHPKPCPTHSCGRDLSGTDLWGTSCTYLAECHYWQWNQPCRWACCRWRGSSCSRWTACCAQGNPQASLGHHQGGEGQLGPKIWRNKEVLVISCKEFVLFCSLSYYFHKHI